MHTHNTVLNTCESFISFSPALNLTYVHGSSARFSERRRAEGGNERAENIANGARAGVALGLGVRLGTGCFWAEMRAEMRRR
jgi:hypothetical protein